MVFEKVVVVAAVAVLETILDIVAVTVGVETGWAVVVVVQGATAAR